MIQRSRRMMDIARSELPLVVILQAWILPPKNELPEIEELRVMAYQALLSGAETLSFFEYNLEIWKKTPGFHDRFRSLMSELTAFSSRYRHYAVESTMGEDGILVSNLTSPAGLRRRVEVNTRRTAVRDFEALQVRIRVLPTLSRPHVGGFDVRLPGLQLSDTGPDKKSELSSFSFFMQSATGPTKPSGPGDISIAAAVCAAESAAT